MLLTSRTSRLLVALLMAIWSPVCFCHADQLLLGGIFKTTQPEQVHHCCFPVEDDAPADQSSSCPCDDDLPGCACPTDAAVPAHTDVVPDAALVVAFILEPLQLTFAPDAVSPATWAHDSRAPGRPATALLQLHCALIV